MPSGNRHRVASGGAAAVTAKQRGVIEAAFREIAADLRDFKPYGGPRNAFTSKTELAKKAFDVAICNTRDLAHDSTVGRHVAKIIQDRTKESLEELRASLAVKR